MTEAMKEDKKGKGKEQNNSNIRHRKNKSHREEQYNSERIKKKEIRVGIHPRYTRNTPCSGPISLKPRYGSLMIFAGIWNILTRHLTLI